MTNTTRAFWNSTILLSALAAGVASQTNEVPDTQTGNTIAQTVTENVAAASTEIDWFTEANFDEAVFASERSGLPLWIDFSHDGCGWCVLLHRDAYPQPEITTYVNEHFIPVHVNRSTEAGKAIAANYRMPNSDPCQVADYRGNTKPLRYVKPLEKWNEYYLLGRLKGAVKHKP